jgi:tetratricopeptide (TPR) repeat protein
VIHGDLKSNNIILTTAVDGKLRAVITDFGLARGNAAGLQPDGSAPAEEAVGGAPGYMAPELCDGGKPSVASDIYALGCICYEMLAGTRVRGELMRVHPKWNGILERCLAPDPSCRYGSVEEIEKALAPKIVPRWALVAAGLVFAAVTGGVTYWKTGTPLETIHLAVLPFEGDAIPTGAGLGIDVAERLSRIGRGFLVIPPGEAQHNNVDTPEKARFALAATHVLRTHLRNSGSGFSVLASVIDTGTGRPLQELRGYYSGNDIPVLAKALTATVTGAFHLRLGVPLELVSAAAYPFYIQGINLLRRDQVSADEAIPLLERACKLDPRSALTYAGMAEADLQKFQRGYGQRWLDLAAESVAKAQSLNSDSAAVLLAAGLLQEQRGWYEEAARDFSRAVELEPNNGEAWNRLAATYTSTNRLDEAIAIYEKAVQAQPNYYAPYIDFGLFYYYRGSFKEAEQLFRRVIAIAPGLAKGHMCLGLALKGLGRLEEAERSLLASLRLQETPQVLTDLGALYYQEERFSEAATYFRKSLSAEPPNALRYANLGDAYRRGGQLQAAAESYRQAQALAEADVAQNPREPFARARLARLFALLGDRRRAEFEIMQALAIGPGNARVLRDAVFTYEALKDREKALQVLGNAPRGLLEELSSQPDLRDLQKDQGFLELLKSKLDEK